MIKVCDAFMGAGKTSAAINYMKTHKGQRFIYVTPYLNETARVSRACPELKFEIPNNYHKRHNNTKRLHLKELVQDGKNVAITHALFKLCDYETIDIIKEQGYCVIIDEVIDIFQRIGITKEDMYMITSSGLLQVEDTPCGKTYTYDIERAPIEYQDGRYLDLFISAAAQRITAMEDGAGNQELCYWTLDERLFYGDNEVIILTFMYNGSIMAAYLEALGIEVAHIGVKKTSRVNGDGSNVYEFVDTPQPAPDHIGQLSSLINIVDNPKLNAIGDKGWSLSHSWYEARCHEKDNQDIVTLKNNTRNFFVHINGKIPYNQRLWSVFKDAKGKISGKGYANRFLSCSIRATNEYKDSTVLAYLVNMYADPTIRHYLAARGATISDNDFALSTMVQWIWRSAIRDGKPITIYIPSRRMRTLLKNWIETEEEKYHIMKAASGGPS